MCYIYGYTDTVCKKWLNITLYRMISKYRTRLSTTFKTHVDGLVQGCSNSSALAMRLLQSCTKPSICSLNIAVPGMTAFERFYFDTVMKGYVTEESIHIREKSKQVCYNDYSWSFKTRNATPHQFFKSIPVNFMIIWWIFDTHICTDWLAQTMVGRFNEIIKLS